MHTLVQSILWGCLLSAHITGAQQVDPINNMCVRLHHQSVVKNNTLYIDGGRETFIDVSGSGSSTKQTGPITEGYNNYLIAIDLTTSWDWKTNISEKALNKTKVPQTGTYPPNVNQGALFHGADSDDNIYLLGGTTSYWNTSFPGFQPPYPAQYSLWSYNTSAQSWGQYDITFGSPNRPNSGSSTEARDQSLAFYFNGQLDSGSEEATTHLDSSENVYLQGMLVVDTNNQTTQNLSTHAVVGDTPRSRGEMQYVENLGGKGILVQIGGNQKGPDDTDNSSMNNLVAMDQIDVFDVSSLYNSSTPDGTWYRQNTTGDTPAGRIDFCLTLVSSDDGSSHNIYMYGGRGMNGTTNEFYDEIWVLSLPSFTWIRIYQGSSPRYGHTCHRVGTRTMLTVGGAENSKLNQAPCDWETKGVGVFDMSAVAWGSVYDANAPDYTVPKLVASKISSPSSSSSSSAAGGNGAAAVMTQPKGGFDQEGLARIFKVPFKANGGGGDAGNSTGPPASSSQLPAPSPNNNNNNNLIGPIIGGVIGGLVLIALLSTLLWYYRDPLKHLLIGQALLPFFSELGDGDGRRNEKKTGTELPTDDGKTHHHHNRWELSSGAVVEKAATPTVVVVEMESPSESEARSELEWNNSHDGRSRGGMDMNMNTGVQQQQQQPVELPSPSQTRTRTGTGTGTSTTTSRNTGHRDRQQQQRPVDRDKPLPIPKLEVTPTSPSSSESESESGQSPGSGYLPVYEKTWI